MNKKIICISIIGMFLLTGVSTSSVVSRDTVDSNATNNEETQNYENDDLISFDTNNHVSQRVTVISDGITIGEINGNSDEIIYLDDSTNEQSVEDNGMINNGLPDFTVTGLCGWYTIDPEADDLQKKYGWVFKITNIGDTYEDENEFIVEFVAHWIYSDGTTDCIFEFGYIVTRWRGGFYMMFWGQDCYTIYEPPSIDDKPISIRVKVTTSAPDSNTENDVVTVPCEWGICVTGIVYKKEILGQKEPIPALIFIEPDESQQYWDNYYMVAFNYYTFECSDENGSYIITAPARQSEYTLRATPQLIGFGYMSLGLMFHQLLLHKCELDIIESLFNLFSKVETIGPVEPNDHIEQDIVLGLFGGITSVQNSQSTPSGTQGSSSPTSN